MLSSFTSLELAVEVLQREPPRTGIAPPALDVWRPPRAAAARVLDEDASGEAYDRAADALYSVEPLVLSTFTSLELAAVEVQRAIAKQP